GRRCWRGQRCWRAPRAKRPTSAWRRRPRTSSTTCSCCSQAAGARSPASSTCSMSAVAEPAMEGLHVEPELARARELAERHNLIALRHSFIDDCETPVSAFLKLRALDADDPAFLLESAEQGQRVGRYS